jgi:hypothetical protein
VPLLLSYDPTEGLGGMEVSYGHVHHGIAVLSNHDFILAGDMCTLTSSLTSAHLRNAPSRIAYTVVVERGSIMNSSPIEGNGLA